jgi:hypothetical protein
MMSKLDRDDLWSLEEYAARRNEFRAEVMQHKKSRQIAIGQHATLYFEDAMTIRYQIQEMLRIERVFEAEGIQDELDAYNPLIPDGSNWKATFMLEYEDEGERKEALAELVGIEQQVWVCVDGFDKVWPICDEDLERSDADKTSSVHFMRWELNADMVTAIKQGAEISMGIDHANYCESVVLNNDQSLSLANDLQQTVVH